MPDLADLAGWIPATVFPLATGLQLLSLLRQKDRRAVSATTWTLFGLANIAAYAFSEKYLLPQSLLAFVLTAVLDFAIVALVLRSRTGGETV